jgi:hypothetical protein
MTDEDGFTPLTPENEKEFSDASEDEGTSQSEAKGDSEYSPVTEDEAELHKSKHDDLRQAQIVEVLIHQQSST